MIQTGKLLKECQRRIGFETLTSTPHLVLLVWWRRDSGPCSSHRSAVNFFTDRQTDWRSCNNSHQLSLKPKAWPPPWPHHPRPRQASVPAIVRPSPGQSTGWGFPLALRLRYDRQITSSYHADDRARFGNRNMFCATELLIICCRPRSVAHSSVHSGKVLLQWGPHLFVLGAANFLDASRQKRQRGWSVIKQTPPATARSEGTEPQPLGKFYGTLEVNAVCFRHVTYVYGPTNKPMITDLTNDRHSIGQNI